MPRKSKVQIQEPPIEIIGDFQTLLKERIANMEKFKEDELKLKRPSKLYLQDLEVSLTMCRQQLQNLEKQKGLINAP